jgi:hypothetical protein
VYSTFATCTSSYPRVENPPTTAKYVKWSQYNGTTFVYSSTVMVPTGSTRLTWTNQAGKRVKIELLTSSMTVTNTFWVSC